jgi:hypothetical protein
MTVTSRVSLGLLLGCAGVAPAAAAASSGIYEQVLLAVGPDGAVQGRFLDTLGQSVTETCTIFFSAAPGSDPTIALKTWDSVRARGGGKLAASSGSIMLTVKAYRQFAGCGMAGSPELAAGLSLDLTRATSWTALEQVSAPKAYLHGAPADGKQPRAYVVQGDVVGLLGTSEGWAHVEYVPPQDTTKSVVGWIRAGEAAPLAPP